jgi:hypothetical protein
MCRGTDQCLPCRRTKNCLNNARYYYFSTFIKSAFRLLRLSPSEFDFTGFKFKNKYYFDKCLPMGASSSWALFESLSTALHWFVQAKSKNNNILHYLDNFLFGGKAGTDQCLDTLEVFKNSCESWGVPLDAPISKHLSK